MSADRHSLSIDDHFIYDDVMRGEVVLICGRTKTGTVVSREVLR